MTDYEHSTNYHKIVSKINETNSLKDIEILRRKLSELEQDDEVRELIDKCDEREKEIKELIIEEKYKKAVSEYDVEGTDLDNQIKAFKELNNYKDSAKYHETLIKEKEYRELVGFFNSGKCDWQHVSDKFEALGGYKDSKKYYEECQPQVEEQRKEREQQEKKRIEAELKEKYQEAQKAMDEDKLDYASMLFKKLGDYKDSKQKAEECKNKQEENELQQNRAKKKRNRIVLIILLSAIIIGVGIYLGMALTHWTVDESAHWHQIVSLRNNYSDHEFYLVEETIPTCEMNGRKLFQCSVCGYLWEETIKTLGHDPDDGVVTKEPTCTESGERTIHCNICGAVIKTETLPKIEHNYVVITTLEPTCLSRGLANYTCSICGYSENRPIDSLGHDWQEKSRTEPTCTKEGLVTYECSRCGKEYFEVISATGHNWTQIEINNATCVNYGTIKSICSSCNETKIDGVPAKGHNYYDGRCLECGFDRDIYEVGGFGPAGGLICYDCDADNSSGNKDGLISSECGWRFLEASTNVLKVIKGVPTINSNEKGYADASSEFVFGYFRKDENGDNLFVNGSKKTDKNHQTEYGIGKGKMNTILLYSAMGDVAYSSEEGSVVTSDYAARLCSILISSNNGELFSDWFLPTGSELKALWKIKRFGNNKEVYWTSTEEYDLHYGEQAVAFITSIGAGENCSRSVQLKVIPFRSF